MASDTPATMTAAQSRLEHFPISFFTLVMGLTGLTLAMLRLEHATGASLASGEMTKPE